MTLAGIGGAGTGQEQAPMQIHFNAEQIKIGEGAQNLALGGSITPQDGIGGGKGLGPMMGSPL